jgi:glycosyltransferase domain-containing protein
MPQVVTIVIPTYNRPEMLFRTLSFLQDKSERFPIIVADGSDLENAARNAECCRSTGSNVSYFHLPSPPIASGTFSLKQYEELQTNFFQRYLLALNRVTTPYVVLNGDDDLLIPETVTASSKFLDSNSDYVACHGMYFNFRYLQNGIEIECSTYDGPSIDGAELGTRLIQLYSRYESPYAAVYRTPIARTIAQQAIEKPLFEEIFQATAAVVAGKIRRLDEIYYFRNVGIPPNPRPFDNWHQWFFKDFDGFFRCYQEYRTKVLSFATEQLGLVLDADGLRRTIDMVFMIYMGREFHILYWIPEYLSVVTTDENERDRLGHLLNERLLGQPQPQSSVEPPNGSPAALSMKTIPGLRMPQKIQARFSEEKWAVLWKRLRSAQR